MKKGLKKLVIFGGLMLTGIAVYRKLKNSEEEDLAKAVSKSIKDKVDETMKEADVKSMIDKKAKEIVKKISFERTLAGIVRRIEDKLIIKVRREIEKAVTGHLFWGWLNE